MATKTKLKKSKSEVAKHKKQKKTDLTLNQIRPIRLQAPLVVKSALPLLYLCPSRPPSHPLQPSNRIVKMWLCHLSQKHKQRCNLLRGAKNRVRLMLSTTCSTTWKESRMLENITKGRKIFMLTKLSQKNWLSCSKSVLTTWPISFTF